MADEQTAPAKKKASAFQKKIRNKAQKAAAGQGRDWKTLPVEERKAFKVGVKQELKAKREAKKKA